MKLLIILRVMFVLVWFAVGMTMSAFGFSNPVSVIVGFIAGAVFVSIMSSRPNQIR